MVGYQMPVLALRTLYHDGAMVVCLVGHVVGGTGAALLASKLDQEAALVVVGGVGGGRV